MSQLDKQVLDINDPTVISQISLSHLPSSYQWKTFWNSVKGDMKKYHFFCTNCPQKYIRKTAYENHLLHCKVESNNIKNASTDNSTNSSSTKSNNAQHITPNSSNVTNKSSRPIKHICKLCGKKYKNTA
eukprot:347568_1